MPQLLDVDDVRRRLEGDRAWSAFALADLDPPYAQHAAWFGTPTSNSVVLVYGAFDPPIVFCQGEPAACEAILAEAHVASRTARAYVNVTDLLWPIVGRNFTTFEPRRMSRMVLHGDLPEASSHTTAVPLGPADLGALRNLYEEDPPAFFLPEQVKDGVYFGVRQAGDLVAVAGTHVVSARGSVAAIGNVYTRPDCRGRGLAAEVTGAVARELRRRGIATIVLNVTDSNDVARRVYQRLGFVHYCVFHEGLARR
jgi:ribosomal protein S18 acetylase RimI-like enzyme